jgi:tRNA pseudouridine38-40 synthase
MPPSEYTKPKLLCEDYVLLRCFGAKGLAVLTCNLDEGFCVKPVFFASSTGCDGCRPAFFIYNLMSKKKVAVVFGYNGSNFFGSQIQSGSCRTVESELESALFQAGLISESNHGNLHKVGWSRVSRTDRGVHAKTTVISMKMQWPGTPAAALPALINLHTPADLKVFAVKEVTSSFNAHGKANFREYEYLFPAKLLLPAGETAFTPAFAEQIRVLTSKFIGTLNFHNYTRKLSFEKPEAKRYIVKFEPHKELVTCGELTFVRFLVTGQSFLYHQIRSMVGAVLAVLMGHWSAEDITASFLAEKKMVPIAPAEGLFLSQVLYTGYNRKQPQKAVVLSEAEEAEVQAFYTAAILPSIAVAIPAFEAWRPDASAASDHEPDSPDQPGSP